MRTPYDPDLIDRYPSLNAYSDILPDSSRPVIGREKELIRLNAGMNRPELRNIFLIASAGTGKTTLVQGMKAQDTDRLYVEVSLALMTQDLANPDELAARVKALFDEASAFRREHDQELVLFIDEFHLIIQLSKAAVEAIKPYLAASGSRGLLVIAATTKEEYHEHVAANQALTERFQRFDLPEPGRKMTMEILRNEAVRTGIDQFFHDDHLFELIYDYTQRYVPASSQPRKSIKILDSMTGWHRATGAPINDKLLAETIYNDLSVNVAFRVDAEKIKNDLDKRVLSQDYATRVVARRLEICVADLHDKTRPMSSFIFTGSTGVGKALVDSTMVPVIDEDGVASWKRHGDLVPGLDRVFGRHGRPIDILGHFPQGESDIYRLTLSDGRVIDAVGSHLWPIYTSKTRANKHAGKDVQPRIMTTDELFSKGVLRTYPNDTRQHHKFFIPMNEPVQWPKQELSVDPYVMGVLIGNGCLTMGPLMISSDDEYTVNRVAEFFDCEKVRSSDNNYNWTFATGEFEGPTQRRKHLQQKDVLSEFDEVFMKKSPMRRIPTSYMTSSVEDRWALVRGLFDIDGSIGGSNDRFNVSYSTFSQGLAEDVRSLLFSLGVSSSVNVHTRDRENEDGTVRTMVEYDVHVKIGQEKKIEFFELPRKRKIAEAAQFVTKTRTRVKKFDMVAITSIEKLPERQSASCIYVDDPEHLYQAGEFVVTHNTELIKAMAELLFGDAKDHLIRFDMAEYTLPESAPQFASRLARQVSNHPFSVLMIDEVEKAHGDVTRILLSVLDDGRITDDFGRTVSLLNTYIIMTTNAGSEVYRTMGQYDVDDAGSGASMFKYEDNIRESLKSTTGSNKFPPELLGRVNAIVPFAPLSEETEKAILKMRYERLYYELFDKKNVRLHIDKRVTQYLIKDLRKNDSDAGGARALMARFDYEVVSEVAYFLNRHPDVRAIRVDVEGVLRSENKDRLETHARIVVSPM